MLKIALLGYGKMGKAIEEIALHKGYSVVLKVGIENLEDLTIENIKKATGSSYNRRKMPAAFRYIFVRQ